MGKGKDDDGGGFFSGEDENKERGNWTGKLDFLLSAIGFAVGLGNVWRFPYLAYSNGGATFLIPYAIMLIFAGLPLFYMEMAMGQFSSLGPISVWKAVPMLKGLGYAMVIISALVCVYYNLIIAYTLFYLFASFTSKLPWDGCQEGWEQYNCANRTGLSNDEIRDINGWCNDLRKVNEDREENGTTLLNYTALYNNYTSLCEANTPASIYWDRVVLDRSDTIEEGADEIRWQLVLCLVLAWIVIFCCLCKGIKSSGKVVYVTATFPYIVLIILCVRNALLPGAIDGIKFYMIPDFDKLLDPTVWYRASTQIFYSLGVAFGALETMTSYNRFRNNVQRDALVVAFLNCGTSVFAGFVIFSVLGFMSYQTGKAIEDVATTGPGLAFIAYPEGLSMMPIAPLWAVLFFLMLFTLGLDSQFAMMETVISAIVDEFPWFQHGKRKICLTGFICILLLLLGLPQCARNGIFIMTLFDWYSAGFSLLIVSLLEVIGISWIYGVKRFSEDINMMIGSKPNIYWQANWRFISPLLLAAIIGCMAWQYTPAYYEGYTFPNYVQWYGWGMVILALAFIPIIAMVEYCKAHGFAKVMSRVLSPNTEWGPALPKHRTGRYKPGDIKMANGKHNLGFDTSGQDTEGARPGATWGRGLAATWLFTNSG